MFYKQATITWPTRAQVKAGRSPKAVCEIDGARHTFEFAPKGVSGQPSSCFVTENKYGQKVVRVNGTECAVTRQYQ